MSISTMLILLSQGFLVSIIIFIGTLLGSLPLGIGIALMRMSAISPISYFARIFISIMRGTPLMLQLLAIFFGPYFIFGIRLSAEWKMIACLLAFIINYAAYFAEIYRSGLQSIPHGQIEACQVLSYSKAQTFRYILLPQLIKRILPAIANEVITLVKDTSLAFVIGISELMSEAKAISASEVSMLPFVLAALMYWIFNSVVERVLNRIEKEMSYYHE